MTLLEAMIADRSGDLKLAALRYEEVLATEQASLEVVLNLAVLYWQVTDPGLAAGKKISADFFAKAGRRFRELLAEAQDRFPASTEARFWKRYIDWADLGEPFGSDECRELLRSDPSVLIPAMHLFALSGGSEARSEAMELLRRCQAEGTARARYVASVIEGGLKRARKP